MRVVNVPPRGLGKTSLEHLIAAARERQIPLLEMARQATRVTALRDKAGRAFEEFTRLIDELSALREAARPSKASSSCSPAPGYREYLSAESRDKGEDRLANLDELITAAHEFDDESSRGNVQEFLAEITLWPRPSIAGTRTRAPSR